MQNMRIKKRKKKKKKAEQAQLRASTTVQTVAVFLSKHVICLAVFKVFNSSFDTQIMVI